MPKRLTILKVSALATLFLQIPPARAQSTTEAAAVLSTQPANQTFFDSLQFDKLLAQNPLHSWIILLILIIAAIALGRIITFTLLRVAARLERRHWHSQAEIFSGLAAPLNLALFSFALSLGLAQLHMSTLLQDINHRALLLLYTIAIFWYAFNLVSVLEVAFEKITARTDTTLDDDLVPVIRKSLRIFIVVIGSLFILQNVFDRDIGAWLAGLGIAALAFSLAAQDSLKNLFGSITILFDRPFTKGQRIKFHTFDGTVEEIGFRSTKVRTGDGSLVTIPNSNIVNDPVDNWALRPKIRRVFSITLTYDTPPEKIREALTIIRTMFTSDEFRTPIHDPDPADPAKIAAATLDPPRAFFDEFNPDSLNIKIFFWFRPANYWDFMAFSERFNLTLMEKFAAAHLEFAFPTQTLHHVNDKLQPEAQSNSTKAAPSK